MAVALREEEDLFSRRAADLPLVHCCKKQRRQEGLVLRLVLCLCFCASLSPSLEVVCTGGYGSRSREQLLSWLYICGSVGAYGLDIGSSLTKLLRRLLKLPLREEVMLRVGMGNPPFLLGQLTAATDILGHPNVFEFCHLPVQSGSNRVLSRMVRSALTVSLFEAQRLLFALLFQRNRSAFVVSGCQLFCMHMSGACRVLQDILLHAFSGYG